MIYDVYLQVKRTGRTHAHVPDWPGCNWLADSPEAAMDNAVEAIARIPAKSLNRYVNTDLNDTLDFAASLDGEFEPVLQTNQPQVVFETCGWRMPGESALNGVSPTSASIYLPVIQKVQ